MGDRFVVGFKSKPESTPVWLYSHYSGINRYEILSNAIDSARQRWNDPSYATRIAISSIVGESWASPLGSGVSAGDDGFTTPDWDDIPIVVWSEQEIWIVDRSNVDAPLAVVSFEAHFNEMIAAACESVYGEKIDVSML